MPTKFRLRRTGQPPLVFVGSVIARVSNRWDAGGLERNNWQEISLYDLAEGGLICKVASLSTHKDNRPHEAIERFDNRHDAAAWLSTFDPTVVIAKSLPESDSLTRLLEEIRRDYGLLLRTVEFGKANAD